MNELAKKKCMPCEGDTVPLSRQDALGLLNEIKDWGLSENARKIAKEFSFKDFAQALAFANKVGETAEAEGHHPDLRISWGKVKIELSTHAIGGLSENDFILAAKIDALPA